MDGKSFWADQVHNDELTDIGPASIRGQILNAVRLYTINYEKLEQRNIGYIRENIERRKKREAENVKLTPVL